VNFSQYFAIVEQKQGFKFNLRSHYSIVVILMLENFIVLLNENDARLSFKIPTLEEF
jgi:hypothetical protein